jgi:hypothetical protein
MCGFDEVGSWNDFQPLHRVLAGHAALEQRVEVVLQAARRRSEVGVALQVDQRRADGARPHLHEARHQRGLVDDRAAVLAAAAGAAGVATVERPEVDRAAGLELDAVLLGVGARISSGGSVASIRRQASSKSFDVAENQPIGCRRARRSRAPRARGRGSTCSCPSAGPWPGRCSDRASR